MTNNATASRAAAVAAPSTSLFTIRRRRMRSLRKRSAVGVFALIRPGAGPRRAATIS